jgi:hypothetical protein
MWYQFFIPAYLPSCPLRPLASISLRLLAGLRAGSALKYIHTGIENRAVVIALRPSKLDVAFGKIKSDHDRKRCLDINKRKRGKCD